ncbi:MAG: hypothetical protein AB9856_05190 [Cellulosilyticaceae bacterium]
MGDYFVFFIRCISSKFKFFKLPDDKKALYLEKYQLYFEAGLLHMKTKNYTRAANCFKHCSAHRYCMKAYEKLGSYSSAIEIADEQGYYEEGAVLCENIGNMRKAAYFYAYFKPLYAARLYKNEKLYFDVGTCYMKAYDFFSALEYFSQCDHEEDRILGFKQVEDTAITLFLTEEYETAFKLFLKLKDYYSALDCAKKLGYPKLIESMCVLIALYEASQGNFSTAAKYIEPYDVEKALLYYYLGSNNTEAIRLLVDHKEYEKALNICYTNNYVELADEISKFCA